MVFVRELCTGFGYLCALVPILHYYYYYYYYYYCDAHFVMFEVCHKQNSVCWHAICYKTKHKTVSAKQKNRRYIINAESGAMSKGCMCYAVHDTHIDSLRVITYFLLYPKPHL